MSTYPSYASVFLQGIVWSEEDASVLSIKLDYGF